MEGTTWAHHHGFVVSRSKMPVRVTYRGKCVSVGRHCQEDHEQWEGNAEGVWGMCADLQYRCPSDLVTISRDHQALPPCGRRWNAVKIPPTLRALGGTAQVAELLAIYAGLILLSNLNLRGTIYSDCLTAVKTITRRWTPGSAFQDAGAA